MRDKLGSYPFEKSEENGRIILRFFPKSETAKNPNSIVFVLSLDKDDRAKLNKIIS